MPPSLHFQRRCLCLEYLHLEQSEWEQAPPSLKKEAAAMLAAVLSDAELLAPLQTFTLIANGIPIPPHPEHVQSVNPTIVIRFAGLHDLAEVLRTQPFQQLTDVLLIAPEYNQILSTMVCRLRQLLPEAVAFHQLDPRQLRIFSDKLLTWQWCKEFNLPIVPGIAITADEYELLRAGCWSRIPDVRVEAAPEMVDCILKPRDGVGCDRVNRLHLPWRAIEQGFRARSNNVQWTPLEEFPFLLQPRITGTSCSIGLMAAVNPADRFTPSTTNQYDRRSNDHDSSVQHETDPPSATTRPVLILPLIEQTIDEHAGMLHYRGGILKVPNAAPPSGSQLVALQAAQRVVAALGRFAGYVGIDMVVRDNDTPSTESASPAVTIIEINPRLCTSYVGYREMYHRNLLGWMLKLNPPRQSTGDSESAADADWRTGVCEFAGDGTVRLQP
ncbi:MAG: ATP-grasp domain-containing protein [Planctomycetaceae bacterium]|nr:ATP-grasp domain-containing protein [Planctomycetaceae bacterium]